MKNILMKSVLIVLSLVMVFSMLSACGNKAEPSTDAIVDAAVKAALDAVATTTAGSITIDADGKQVTIEDAQGKTVQQLLTQAGITLNEGDLLTLSPNQMISDNILLQVLRRFTVTILVEETGAQHSVTLFGSTVADALAAAGVELAEYQTVNFDVGQLLENGMEIVISGQEEPEETEPTEPDKPAYSGPTNRPSSSPDPDDGKTIVSVQYYDDCDGSGHGVKVITYSDGTQKEVPY